MDDIDRAAIAFPDLNFEIVHGGSAFVEETAWQLARFHNVWVNLEITSAMLVHAPGQFHDAMFNLMRVGQEHALRRIMWGLAAWQSTHAPRSSASFASFGSTTTPLREGHQADHRS